MYITRALIGRKSCLEQAIQTQKSKLREFFKNMSECCYFIKQLLYGFLGLDGLIQTRGKVARVKKSARNTNQRRVIFRVFLNSSNFPNPKYTAMHTFCFNILKIQLLF